MMCWWWGSATHGGNGRGQDSGCRTLGALPALAANAQLPHMCGASYNCALVAGRAWPASFNVAVLSTQSCPGHGPLPSLGLLSLGQPFLLLILHLAWPHTTALSARLPLLSLLSTLFLPRSLRSQSLPSTVLASALRVTSSWLSFG